uniref:TMF_TATA_bd domain-containing protein n=1 Tax=Meloidogyne hapla TaxID=6305 RepID=A0A1I8B145_MELHA
MSFGGFTNFAKNALLTAQKHIDSALHIEEEGAGESDVENEDDETEREDNNNLFENSASVYKSAILDPIQSDHLNELKYNQKEAKNDPKLNNQPVDFMDVDLNEPSSHHSEWREQPENKNQTVVDTEPNPIRDAHEPTNIFNYSPSSHSPDDDESSQNGQSTTTAQNNSEPEMVSLNMEKGESDDAKSVDNEQQTCIVPSSSEKTLDRFEEIRTIASSDIEVIRQIDDWSITSSHNNGSSFHNPIRIVNTNKEDNQQQISTSNSSKDLQLETQSVQEMTEQIALLFGKLKNKDQRIEELGRLNDNLKLTNENLTARYKQKNASETKLKTQLADTEKQLNDLLGEGKKLSEYSGRQAKEIRKLKQELSQLEIVTAARDSAIEELQELNQQTQEQETHLIQLNEELEKSENDRNRLNNEIEKLKNKNTSMENQLLDQLKQLENAKDELKRLEKDAKTSSREREELIKENKQLANKLMNKSVQEGMEDERERGIIEDLDAEKARHADALKRIKTLEQQLESLQDNQRDIALEISTVSSLERQNESLTRSLNQASIQLSEKTSKSSIMLEMLGKNLDDEKSNFAAKVEEYERLQNEYSQLECKLKLTQEELLSQQRKSILQIERIERRIKEVEIDLNSRNLEIGDLQRKNNELEQKLAKSRKEQITPTFVPKKSVIIANDELNDLEGKNIGAKFKQQRQEQQQILAQKHTLKSFQKPSSSNQTRNEVDAIIHGNTTDYLLDIPSVEHLRSELDSTQAQLYQLRERFDHLLELYGGCLESIEELKEDNEDLRKLCKEQALKMSSVKCQEDLTNNTDLL